MNIMAITSAAARHGGCRCDSVCAAGCGSSERPRQVEAYATQRLRAPSRTTIPETEAGAHPPTQTFGTPVPPLGALVYTALRGILDSGNPWTVARRGGGT